MRKAWIVFVFFLFLICPPQSSAKSDTGSSSKLDSLAQGFSGEEKNLRETRTEMWQLYQALRDNYLALVVYKLEVTEVLCGHQAQLISFYGDTKDSAKKDYAAKVISASELAKKRMQQSLKTLEEMRSYIPYPPVLPLMDKAKTSIESAIGLLDDTNGAFRSLAK
jgi:hypothetical protein